MKKKLIAAVVMLLCIGQTATAGIVYHAVATYDEEESDSLRHDERRVEANRKQHEGLFRVIVDVWVDGVKAKIKILESDHGSLPVDGLLLTRDGGKTVYYLNERNKRYALWDHGKMNSKLEKLSSKMEGLLKKKIGEVNTKTVEQKSGGTIAGLETTYYKLESGFETSVGLFGKKKTRTVVEDRVWLTDQVADLALNIWMVRRAAESGNKKTKAAIEQAIDQLPGVPLRVRTVYRYIDDHGETVTHGSLDIKKIRQEALSPETFQIPEDYQETSMTKALLRPSS